MTFDDEQETQHEGGGRSRRAFLTQMAGTLGVASSAALIGPLDAAAGKRRRRHGVRAADSAGRYLAAYNGNSNEGGSTVLGLNGYGIGFAVSDDGARSFNRVPGGKLFKPSGGSNWDSSYVKDPSIAVVGRRLFLAHMGTADGNTLKIGLATWKNGIPVGKPQVRKLLLDTAGAPAWESGSVHFPHLYFDEDTETLHLWYSGQSSLGSTTSSIGHATIDTDTLEVTKDPSNPIIGPSGPDGEGGLVMGCVFKDVDGTWNLFTGAFNLDATRANSVRYTAPAPEGPWTRDGVVYDPRPNAISPLTADATAGATVISVSNSSVFTKGDPVFVQDNLTGTNPAVRPPDNWEVNYVAALPDGGHVRLREPLSNTYATSRNAEIVVLDQVKLMPRSCLKEHNKYVLPSTAWFAGNQTYHEETVAITTNSLSTKPYRLSRASGLLLDKTGSTGSTRNAWDKTSSENMSAIEYSGIDKIVNSALRSPASRVTRTRSGGLGLSNTNWATVDSPGGPGQGLDGYLAAFSGDVIRVTPQIELGPENRWVYFDVVTVIFPASVGIYRSWASGGTGGSADQGVIAWRCQPGDYVQLGAPILVTVGDNDIECGMVNLRLMYRLSPGSGSRYLHVSRAVSYENLGGGDA
jgi:hypothetical protein